MSASTARSARSNSLPHHARLSDSEKMEGTGSWEAIEWTKHEPVARTVSHGMSHFLLEAEEVIVEGYGVVLVNTKEAGTLLVTNYRLLFVSEKTRDIIALGTIPLATIEKFNKIVIKQQSTSRQSDRSSSRRLLQLFGNAPCFLLYVEFVGKPGRLDPFPAPPRKGKNRLVPARVVGYMKYLLSISSSSIHKK